MPNIALDKVSVDFPVFNSRSRGLVNTLFGYAKSDQRRIEKSGLSGVQVHALADIDLKISEGDRLALIGRNGAGKTTLLRVLSGAYEPTRGRIQIAGKVSSLTDLSLGMDMEADGYENIVLRSIVMGLTKKQALALVPEIEKFTELGDYLNLPVRAYSSGMLLRLAFAVSTAIVPDILLMDEMIGAGDSRFMDKVQARMHAIMSSASVLVLASHSEAILKRFCNKGVVLAGGRIVHHGSVDDCLKFYESAA